MAVPERAAAALRALRTLKPHPAAPCRTIRVAADARAVPLHPSTVTRSREAGDGGPRGRQEEDSLDPARPRGGGRGPAPRRSWSRADGAGGRHGLPGHRLRGGGRGGRRPGRQHQPDRLPGGLHRPLVRRPGRRHDLPADRQLRAPGRRRPVGPAVASGAGRGPCDGRRDGSGAPAGPPAARERRAGHRRSGHARGRAAPARDRRAAGHRHGPRRDRPGRRGGRGTRGAALGGPGLRGGRVGPGPVRGAAIGSRHERRRAARGGHRLRPQAQHRGRAGGARRTRARHAPYLDGRPGPHRRRGRRRPLAGAG